MVSNVLPNVLIAAPNRTAANVKDDLAANTTIVYTYLEATRELQQGKFDLALVGYQFDGRCPDRLIAHIHAVKPMLPVVCVNAFATELGDTLDDLRESYRGLGATDFIDVAHMRAPERKRTLQRVVDQLAYRERRATTTRHASASPSAPPLPAGGAGGCALSSQ